MQTLERQIAIYFKLGHFNSFFKWTDRLKEFVPKSAAGKSSFQCLAKCPIFFFMFCGHFWSLVG